MSEAKVSNITDVPDIVNVFPMKRIDLVNQIESYLQSCSKFSMLPVKDKKTQELMIYIEFKYIDAFQPELNHSIGYKFNHDFFYKHIEPLLQPIIN